MTKIVTTTKLLVINEKHELLVLKIGVHKQQPERSHSFDLPGGFVNPGESEREGAVREVKEETGIELDTSELQLIWSETNYYEDHDASVTHLNYLVKINHTPDVTVSWEHESYEWIDLEQSVDRFEQRPRFKKVIEYVRQYKFI